MKRLAIQPHDADSAARGFGYAWLGGANLAAFGLAANARRHSPRTNP